MKTLFSIIALLGLCLPSARAAVLTATTEELVPGREWQVHIVLDNADNDNLTAFQLSVALPAGVDYIAGSATGSTRLTDHSLFVAQDASGNLRIAALSPTNAALTGNTGDLLTLRLTAADGLDKGNYTLTLSQIIVADRLGEEKPLAGATATLSSSGTSGEAATYQLTYMLDDKVYYSTTLTAGDAITPPEDPTKEGYTFLGWTGLPTTMTAEDLTVYAAFEVNAYTVTYYLDGTIFTTQEVNYGEAITPPDVPEKEGYTFQGWTGLPTTMPDEDLTVYAAFEVNTYTVTYYLDGTIFTTQEVNYGEAITPPDVPEKEGYTFSGWQEVPKTMPARDISIYGSYDVLSGIGAVNGAGRTDQSIYTITGIRILSKPLQRGVYIIGGRKVYVK